MKRLFYLIFLLTLVLPIAVQPVFAASETYAAIRNDYQRLMQSSQLQRHRDNWEQLIQRFERFVEQNPSHEAVEKALYLKAKTWEGLSRAAWSKSDVRRAMENYLQLVKRYPDSQLADDALYNAGKLAEERLNDKTAAYDLYRQLVEQLPNSDMFAQAKGRLDDLPTPQGRAPELVVADPPQEKGASIRLEEVRYWSGPEYTRIVLDLNAPVAADPQMLKGKSPRIYFDLVYTQLAEKIPATIPIDNGLVQRVRTSTYDSTKSRVVIDLEKVSDYKLTSLNNPYRIVIDVMGAASKSSSAATGSAETKLADDSIASILNKVPTSLPTLHVPQQRKDQGLRLIVVDAGHGGKDPGAVGPRKVLEKNVTLGMAKRLAEKLRKELGVKVLLTRSNDKFIELRDRTAYANRVDADLFISLHANANHNSKAYGLETYFLNLSKNNQAAAVAARENGTSLQDVSNLEAILFDLMANAKINESSRLAAEVQQSMVAGLRPHYSNIKDLGVRQGPFHVLLGATMPSILVEAAFISNKREEKRLNSRDYQERVASAIVKGVKNYVATIDRVAKR